MLAQNMGLEIIAFHPNSGGILSCPAERKQEGMVFRGVITRL
jgi:hypothetical protein